MATRCQQITLELAILNEQKSAKIITLLEEFFVATTQTKAMNPANWQRHWPSPLTAGQAVEYYEPARYGTLKAWAAQLGMADCEVRIKRCSEQRRRTNC